jgi:predicted 2-oxoglutarate/Fe(II)-dependent dioxygenase YbiX
MMIKSRTTRQVKPVTRMGRKININFWYKNLKERDHLEDLCIDGRIIQ